MILIVLDDLSQLSGLFGLIAVLVAWFYGAIVLYKYFQTKEKSLFYFFLAIIFTMAPWYPSGLGYVYWLFTREELAYQVYVLLGTLGTPIALLSWLQIYMPALHKKKKRISDINNILFISSVLYLSILFCIFCPWCPC